MALLIVFELSPLSFEAETRLVNPLLFRLREMLDRSPALHPHIKTYAVDDATVASMQKPHLLLEQWVDLLEKIDSRKPRAIVIDALFSVVDSALDKDEAQRNQLLVRLSRLTTPVIVGSYATPRAIRGRESWALSDPALQLQRYMHSLANSPLAPEQEAAALPLANFLGAFVYGPQSFLQPVLSRIGHIHYGQREGRFYPFLRLSPNRVLPYIMLRGIEDVKFFQGVLQVQGTELPMTRDGSAMINFSSYETYRKHVRPLRLLLSNQFSSKELGTISGDDFIYIVPMYYTGNTDYKPSPIGLLPGAFAHLAVLNSLLLKSWLRPIEAGPWLIVGFGVIAALLTWWLNPGVVIALLLLGLGLWTLVCIACFVGLGWVLPWLAPSLSFASVGFCLVGFRVREAERKAQYIRQTFEGSVQPETLHQLAQHPEKLTLEARERVLTIVFIDIVGFSLMVENQLPRTAFESLRGLIEDLSTVVHNHGGIVNKTLGDGLLCFFGYSFEEDREFPDHAEQALQAALEIQQSNVHRMLKAARNREPVFPLRIGINTAAVFLGNLGTGSRLDFTVIGNGVNFTKRLEGACRAHSVLVGTNSKELIEPLGTVARGTKRMITIKHHSDMVESWEYDPFIDKPELRDQAEEAYKTAAYLTRVERRWTVADPEKIIVTTISGVAHLLNFSSTGLSISLAGLIPNGTRMTLQIDSVGGLLQQQLAALGLQTIQVEVRWVQESEGSNLHGVRYLDLNDRQTDLITDLLCQFAIAEIASTAS